MGKLEKVFKYVGVIAVFLVAILFLAVYAQNTRYQDSYANFKAVAKQVASTMKPKAKLTAQQRNIISQAAQKVASSKPIFELGKSESSACQPGTAGCGSVSLCQNMAGQIWDYWEAGGVDPISGVSNYDRAEMLWNAFIELCY